MIPKSLNPLLATNILIAKKLNCAMFQFNVVNMCKKLIANIKRRKMNFKKNVKMLGMIYHFFISSVKNDFYGRKYSILKVI